MMLTGFSPIVAPQSRVLILGSMPGVESLRQQEYYAHPRNAFWLIMGELIGAGPELDYAERIALLKRNRISLWDVLDRCVRPGSLDGDIERKSETVNPLVDFCREQPGLRALAFNGRKARETFQRHFFKKDPVFWQDFQLIDLPSTSPAYASLRPLVKLEIWRKRLQPVLSAKLS
jgi:hypoxanthine-DNA glycosylase